MYSHTHLNNLSDFYSLLKHIWLTSYPVAHVYKLLVLFGYNIMVYWSMSIVFCNI